MTCQERLEQAKKLEQDNQALLSTPLMSEGSISPMQVGLFSPRAKARWQKDTMAKMELEYTIKQLRRTDEEIACDEKRIASFQERERKAILVTLQSKIDFYHGLGCISHNKYGKLRPAYQRTIDAIQREISKLSNINKEG